MKQIKVNKFLDESEELKEIIRDNHGVYIIGGCGIGKSYFVREFLMTTYITINVNFLNVLNLLNFVDSYIDRNAIINSNGKESISINVKNLLYISDEALDNIDLVVVDEILELWLSSNYRGETGDSLMNLLIRAKGKGCKIVVISGTPIGGVSIVEKLNLEVVEVIKTQIEDKDTYNYIFLLGLTKLNIGEFAKQLIEQGYTIVIKSDRDRKEIKLRLTLSGIDFEDILSSDKLVSGYTTNYIVNNQKLPDLPHCFLTTSVLVGGLNLNELPTEKKILYICFANDIGTPHLLILLMGRSREQSKNIVIGYKEEEDFDINFSHIFYQNNNNLLSSESRMEVEDTLSSCFNRMIDWCKYIKNRTYANIVSNTYKNYIKENIIIEPTNWLDFIQLAIEEGKFEAPYYRKCFKVKSGSELKVIKSPNKWHSKWIYCSNVVKGERILKALELYYPIDTFDSEKLDVFIELFGVALLYLSMTKKAEDLFRVALDDIRNDRLELSSETFQELFRKLFCIRKTVNGKCVGVSVFDERLRINHPLNLINCFPKAFKSLVLERNNNFTPFLTSEFDLEYEVYIKSRVNKKALVKLLKVQVIQEGTKKLIGHLWEKYESISICCKALAIDRRTISNYINSGFIIKL